MDVMLNCSPVASRSALYWSDNVDEALITIDRDRGKKAAAARVGAFFTAGFPVSMFRAGAAGRAARATSEDDQS
jgi:hypothetical protein